VLRSRDNVLTVGAKGRASYRSTMTAKKRNLIARFGIQNTRGALLKCCDDTRAVGAECRIPCKVVATNELGDLLAGLSVPEANGGIVRRSNDALAVRTKLRAVHLSTHLPVHPVIIKRRDLLTRFGIPQPRVQRCGNDALAVGAEYSAIHRSLMAKLGELLSSFCIPQSRGLVQRCG